MITVLGRAIKETEAKSVLVGLRKRTFPGQHKVRLRYVYFILYQDGSIMSAKIIPMKAPESSVYSSRVYAY